MVIFSVLDKTSLLGKERMRLTRSKKQKQEPGGAAVACRSLVPDVSKAHPHPCPSAGSITELFLRFCEMLQDPPINPHFYSGYYELGFCHLQVREQGLASQPPESSAESLFHLSSLLTCSYPTVLQSSTPKKFQSCFLSHLLLRTFFKCSTFIVGPQFPRM